MSPKLLSGGMTTDRISRVFDRSGSVPPHGVSGCHRMLAAELKPGEPAAFLDNTRAAVNAASIDNLAPGLPLPDEAGYWRRGSSRTMFPTKEILMPRNTIAFAALLAASLLAHSGLAQDQARVEFETGNDNAAINGTIVGDAYIDYVLGAKKGQTMAVSLVPGESNGLGTVYFNILPPGSTGEAIYNGSIDGLDATGIVLPQDGDYAIRVYQMGDDADSGKTTGFMISVGIN
jgi:hypothetical protein